MRHGGIGFLDRYKLFLPPELLRMLGVNNQTELFGMYYPRNDYPRPSNEVVVDDLMLTPIPYGLWPKVARYTVKVWHEPGSIARLSEVLASEGISIHLAEITRSGFRYDMWNLTVSLDFLGDGRSLTFDRGNCVFRETYEQIDRIEKLIIERCSEVLFSAENNMDLRKPVRSIPQTALAYFYNVSCTKDRLLDPDLMDIFTLRHSRRLGCLVDGGKKRLHNIIDHIAQSNPSMSEGALLLVSADAGDLNMRVAIVPGKATEDFFEFIYEYKKPGRETTQGLLAHVLGKLPATYNIWQLVNHTKLNTRTREEGSIRFIVQDQDRTSSIEAKSGRAEAVMTRICTDPLPVHLSRVQQVSEFRKPRNLGPARLRAIFNPGLRKEGKRAFDVFLCYCHEDAKEAKRIAAILEENHLRVFVDTDQIRVGEKYPQGIRDALVNSKSFLVICSAASLNSSWVRTETGAAWGLGLLIIPVLFGIPAEQLPVLISDRHSYSSSDIEEYVPELAGRLEGEFDDYYPILGLS